jgi:DNA primase
MRLHQIDVPAVALLGIHLSRPQEQLLRSASRVVFMFDGDSAGSKAASKLKPRIASFAKVAIAWVPHGADPDDLSDLELRHSLSTARLTTGP